MASMQRFEDGVVIPALHKTKRQYGSLLLVIADGKARAQLLETKKAVSSTTERICTHCNVTSSQRAHVYDFTSPSCPLLRTTSESHERDYELMQTSTGDAVAETFSKALGQSGKPHAFSRMSGQLFFLEGMPYDHIMHSEAEGLLKVHIQSALRHAFKSTKDSDYYHPNSLNGGQRGGEIEASFNLLLKRHEWPEEDMQDKPKPLKAWVRVQGKVGRASACMSDGLIIMVADACLLVSLPWLRTHI